IDEAQDVTQEHRHDRPQLVQPIAVRHLHFEHHDRDDDGDDTVAERFQSRAAHPGHSVRQDLQEARPAHVWHGPNATTEHPVLREANVLSALFLTLLLTGPVPQQPRLSDEQIDQVLAYARTGDGLGGARCYAAGRPDDRSEFSGGFAVMLTGPAGRIFDAAKAAKAKGL